MVDFSDGRPAAAPTPTPAQENYMQQIPCGWLQPTWRTAALAYNASAGSTYLGDAVLYNSAPAQNQAFGWHMYLSAGNYDLAWAGQKGPDAGIVQWELSQDAGATWSAIGTADDQYAAAVATRSYYAARKTFTVAAGKLCIIRLRVTDKNASSTNYYMYPSMFWVRRVAA